MDCLATYIFAIPISIIYPFFISVCYDKLIDIPDKKFMYMMIISIIGVAVAIVVSQYLTRKTDHFIPGIVGLFKGSLILAMYYIWVNWNTMSVNLKLTLTSFVLAGIVYLSFHARYIKNLYPFKGNTLCRDLDIDIINEMW